MVKEYIHIILADDDEDDRLFFKDAFEEVKVQTKVEFVFDGLQLMEHLMNPDTKLPDILFLDLNMPKMDGYTLCSEIKANENLRRIHIILHSSLSGVFNQAMVSKVGADQFIAKFHPDELTSAVQKWINAS